jgi:hypothetical protein
MKIHILHHSYGGKEKMAMLLWQKLSKTVVDKKNAIFHRKSAKIAENIDHCVHTMTPNH